MDHLKKYISKKQIKHKFILISVKQKEESERPLNGHLVKKTPLLKTHICK